MHQQQVINILKRGSYTKTISVFDQSTIPTLDGKPLPVKHIIVWALKRGPNDYVRADYHEIDRMVTNAPTGAKIVFPDYDGNQHVGNTIYVKKANGRWEDQYETVPAPELAWT